MKMMLQFTISLSVVLSLSACVQHDLPLKTEPETITNRFSTLENQQCSITNHHLDTANSAVVSPGSSSTFYFKTSSNSSKTILWQIEEETNNQTMFINEMGSKAEISFTTNFQGGIISARDTGKNGCVCYLRITAIKTNQNSINNPKNLIHASTNIYQN